MRRYGRCRTCGRYTPLGELTSGGSCCDDCAQAYTTCVNCGRFFARGLGFDAEHCGRDCTTRYVILRTYGPQPVTLIPEA